MSKRATASFFVLLFGLSPSLRSEDAAKPDDSNSNNKDLCSYLKDIDAKKEADCGQEALASLRSKDPAGYSQKIELTHKRKADILKAYEFLKTQPPPDPTSPQANNQNQPSPIQLQPPINERTFPAWIGPEAADLKEVCTRWLQAQSQELQREQKAQVPPERRKEIDAALAVNQAKIAGLQKLKDPSQFRCFLGESCGGSGNVTDPAGQVLGAGESWTAADYERANVEAKRQNLAPGGKLDRGMPDLTAVGSEVVANTPLWPLFEKPKDKSPSDLGTVANIALIATGALLLFGGLGGKRLEEKFPGTTRNMGLAALFGGALATGAIAWEGSVARVAATAIPLAANPQVEEEASEGLVAGQQVVQRVAQSAPNLTHEGQATIQQVGSQLTTQASRLLNVQQAQIDIRKFTEYALNPNHAVGVHKAKVFEAALGYTRNNFEGLVAQVRTGILNNPATQGVVDKYGTHFTVDMLVRGPAGQAVVRTGWIYPVGSQVPRMTTVFVR